jgi:hypothetical protein
MATTPVTLAMHPHALLHGELLVPFELGDFGWSQYPLEGLDFAGLRGMLGGTVEATEPSNDTIEELGNLDADYLLVPGGGFKDEKGPSQRTLERAGLALDVMRVNPNLIAILSGSPRAQSKQSKIACMSEAAIMSAVLVNNGIPPESLVVAPVAHSLAHNYLDGVESALAHNNFMSAMFPSVERKPNTELSIASVLHESAAKRAQLYAGTLHGMHGLRPHTILGITEQSPSIATTTRETVQRTIAAGAFYLAHGDPYKAATLQDRLHDMVPRQVLAALRRRSRHY